MPFLVVLALLIGAAGGFVVASKAGAVGAGLIGQAIGFPLGIVAIAFLITWIISKVKKTPVNKKLWGWLSIIAVIFSIVGNLT